MARSALGKLSEASQLRKIAAQIGKADPSNAVALRELAHKKTSMAVRQMRRKPKKKVR
ncbi:hypothetical protein ES703_108157 [subsurface metagenome]